MKKTILKSAFVLFGLTLCTLWFAQVASAQSISGVVTDQSGAVMAGVEVSGSSPGLIEGSRTVLTNDVGRYALVNLSIGTYSVTFKRAGFAQLKREGIVLTAGYNAPVNAVMKIATMAEVVTVSGATPVVDVQSIALTQVQTRIELDAIPTKNRGHVDLALTLPGTAVSGFGDLSYHGTSDSLTTVDGMRATTISVGGTSFSGAFSNEMFQEMSFTTAMESAEIGQSGMMVNLVPKDGGNKFHGTTFFNFTTKRLQDRNTAGINEQYNTKLGSGQTLLYNDLNSSFGGPIKKDKLWFQATVQFYRERTESLNSFGNKSVDKTYYVRDENSPNVFDPWRAQGSMRLTWQATSKDKISGLFDNQYQYQGHTDTGLAGVPVGPESALITDTPVQRNIQVKWSRIHTPRLLIDFAFSIYKQHQFFDFQEPNYNWSGRFVADTSVPKVLHFNRLTGETTNYSDFATGYNWGPFPLGDGGTSDTMTINPSVSYVTGSHVLKAGLHWFRGSYFHGTSRVGLASLSFFGGNASSATIGPGFFPMVTNDNIKGDFGWYVQDKWTIKRLTLNLGLRLDHFISGEYAVTLPATVWLPRAIDLPAEDILGWKDLSPRIGAAYDVFGNGKTSVRFGLARYVAAESTYGTSGNAKASRMALNDFATWKDLNGDRTIFNADGTVQNDELKRSNPNFGTEVIQTTIDPKTLSGWFARGYSWEYNIGVQHELLPRVAVNFLWYRRWGGNVTLTDNQYVFPAGSPFAGQKMSYKMYDGPFCLDRPSDPRLPDGGGGKVCGLYDINPAAYGIAPINYKTFAKNLLGEDLPNYNQGFDITVNGRFLKGAFIQGGFAFRKTYTDNTLSMTFLNPQFQYPIRETPYNGEFKLNGQYTLPWQIAVSGSYQMLRGPAIGYSYNAPIPRNAAGQLFIPELGRGLASGSLTKSITISEPAQEYFPFTHEINLRFSKTFQIRDRYSIRPMLDFYNISNSDGIRGINTTYNTTNWNQPTRIVQPRQIRISAHFQF